MGRSSWLAAVLFMVAAALSVGSVVAATSHVVGGQTAWTIPPNPSFYSTWASAQTIAVGDKLVFNFPTGIHNVIEVPKSTYDSCTVGTQQLGATLSTGPATVALTTAGTHYFVCGITGHCAAGQKLAITVSNGKSPAAHSPALSTAPAPSPPAPVQQQSLPPAEPNASTAPASSSSGKTSAPVPTGSAASFGSGVKFVAAAVALIVSCIYW